MKKILIVITVSFVLLWAIGRLPASALSKTMKSLAEPNGIRANLDAGQIGSLLDISADPGLREVRPAVAYNPDRQEYLVVWYNDLAGNDDIHAQRITKDGAKIGNAVCVSCGPGVERRFPSVAYNSRQHEYLVVWEAHGTAVVNIAARSLSAMAQPLGNEFAVTLDVGPAENIQPAVAYSYTANKYLVVFAFSPWGHNWSIKAVPVFTGGIIGTGAPFEISGDPGGKPRSHPALAYNRVRNEFLVAWQQEDSAHYHVYGRRVTAAALLPVPAFAVSPLMGYDYKRPAVGALSLQPHGQYLVVFEDYSLGAVQIDALPVRGDGAVPPGGSVTVNSPYTWANQSTYPAVAGNEKARRYLVTWVQRFIASPGPPQIVFDGICAREVSANGNRLGDRETTLMDAPAERLAVTAGARGDFLIAFQSPPGNQNIYGYLWGARSYLPVVFGPSPRPIFAADFNDGSLAHWIPHNGNWVNQNKQMRGAYNLGNAWNMRPEVGADFRYEGTVNLLTGNAAGLTFRSSVDGVVSYDVILDAVDGVFKISKRPPYRVLASYYFAVQRHHSYRVKIVARGNKLEAYLDGVKRLSVTDGSHGSGHFGVILFRAEAAYDDLQAWALP